MATNRHELGVKAARQIRTAEHQMDMALAEALSLGQLLLRGRAEAGFAAAVGQQAMTDLARSFTLMTEARGAMVAAHDGLADVAAEHSVRWRMDGPIEDKPVKPEAPALRRVA